MQNGGRGRGRGRHHGFGGPQGGHGGRGGVGGDQGFMGGNGQGPMHMDHMGSMDFQGGGNSNNNNNQMSMGNMPPVMQPPFGMQGRPMPPMQPPGPPPMGNPINMQQHPPGPPMQQQGGPMSLPPVPMHLGHMQGAPPNPPGMMPGPSGMPPHLNMPPIMGMPPPQQGQNQQAPGPPPLHMNFQQQHIQQPPSNQPPPHMQQQGGMMGPVGGMGPGPGGGGPGQGPGMHRQNVSAAAMAQAGRGGTGYKAPGSQSAAPNAKEVKNDYCQQFVDTGARPQNYLRDSHLTDRYEEYPKMKELIRMKDQMVAENTTPAYILKADLRTLRLSPETFGTKFDVILVDPPWEEYVRRAPHAPGLKDREFWSWQDIQALEIENIADNPSFIFLWCGTAEGLDAGRHCLNKWGFRRVEDIVWIKTNKERNPRTGYLQAINQEPYSILSHTKEHCLMGIKGSVRRNTDGHLIHANCDTDVIVSEEPPNGSTEKPAEMYEIIERFCLAKRRIELFGEDHNIRNGWVTVGRSLSTTNFRPEVYGQHFKLPDGRPYVENSTGGRVPRGAPILIPTPPEVEEARPKSPPNMRGPGRG